MKIKHVNQLGDLFIRDVYLYLRHFDLCELRQIRIWQSNFDKN